MSPFSWLGLSFDFRFPRVSGDEPVFGAGDLARDKFSPRERG